MKLRHAAAIVPCAIALTACTAVTNTQNADLAGRPNVGRRCHRGM